MQVSQWVILGVIELIGLMLLVCVYLFIHARSLTALALRLQHKARQLAQDLHEARNAYQQLASRQVKSYSLLLDEQLDSTIDHHRSLPGERDIEDDLDSQSPSQRLLTSIRFAFLQSEKAAARTDKPSATPNWDILYSKLGNLLTFFRSKDFSALERMPLHELSTERHTEQHAGIEAKQHTELQAVPDRTNTSPPGHAAAELERLKAIAANQHSLINDLQKRLAAARTQADTDSLIQELQSQLDQQLRYFQESETCIKLMERELEEAQASIQQLQARVKQREQQLTTLKLETRDWQAKTSELMDEQSRLQQTLDRLHAENEQLVQQMQANTPSEPETH